MEKMCFSVCVITTEPRVTKNLLNYQGLDISRRSFSRSVEMNCVKIQALL